MKSQLNLEHKHFSDAPVKTDLVLEDGSTVQIPTIFFTKAELIFCFKFILPTDIHDHDNSTKFNMVELRHICNLMKKEIAQFTRDMRTDFYQSRENNQDIAQEQCSYQDNHCSQEHTHHAKPRTNSMNPKDAHCNQISQLRLQFPDLSDEDFYEVIDSVKKQQQKDMKQVSQEDTTKIPSKNDPTIALYYPDNSSINQNHTSDSSPIPDPIEVKRDKSSPSKIDLSSQDIISALIS